MQEHLIEHVMIEYKIYKITECDEIKHIYIVFTIQTLEQRLRDHICHSSNKNYYMCNWLKKLKKQGKKPKISLIKLTTLETWEQDEINEINKAREDASSSGIKVLNICNGGRCPNLGKPMSEETKEKISKSKKGKKPSEEHCKKISEHFQQHGHPWTGRKHSASTLEKLSTSHLGNKSALGHKLSDECKLQISKSKKKHSEEIISQIKAMLEAGIKQCEIVEKLKVSRWAVYSTKYNKTLET